MSIALAALLVVALSLSPGSTAWAGFFDDLLESAEDVVEDTTDYIEEKVEGEAKDGVDDVFEGEQPGAQPPAEQPQATPPQTAAPEQPSVSEPSPSSTGGQSQVEMAMEVQDRLNGLGYDAGPVDGLPGTKTVNAIAAFQRDHGLAEDGKITAALVDALRAAHQAQLAQPQVAQPAQSGGSATSPSAMSQTELTRETQERLNALGYDAGPADGVYGLKTGLAIAAFQRDNGLSETGNVSAALVEALRTAGAGAQPATTAAQPQVAQPAQSGGTTTPPSAMSQTELTREAQERLNALGYDAGPADGVYGLKTGLAIAAFQRDNGLSETGNVSAALVEALRTAGAQPATTAAQSSQPPAADSAGGAQETASTPVETSADSSLVLEALPTASTDAAPAGSKQSSVSSEGAPPGAQAYAALARSLGVHLVRGRPVISRNSSVLTREQGEALTKFFDFVELGLDPGLVEAVPICWAKIHLPQDVSQRYVRSGPVALGAANMANYGGEIVAWQGSNEFEEKNTKETFVSDQAASFKSKAVGMPFEVVAIDEVTLPQYDAQRGGFQLHNMEGLERYGFTFPRGTCTNDFAFSPPATKFPQVWRLDPARAQQVIESVNERKVYVATSLRFRAMPDAKVEDQYRPSARIPVWSEVTSLGIYSDADLERLIGELPVVNGRAPILLAGLPESVPAQESIPIDEESLAVLMIRDHGDVLDAEAWQLLMLRQLEKDRAYYERKLMHNPAQIGFFTETDGYDTAHLPFFPKGFNGSFQTQFPDPMVALFKKWAMQRATELPEALVLRAQLWRQGNDQPARLVLPVPESDRSALAEALVSKGYSFDQILRPDVNPMGVGPRFDDRYLKSAVMSRRPALVLPNIASSYLPPFSDQETERVFEGSSGSRPVEITISAGPSEFVAIDNNSEAFVLQATPTKLRAWNNDGSEVVLDKTYEVAALDPKRLDVASLVVKTPDSEAMPLSAETVDLLAVKYVPDAVSDKEFDRIMMARWAYEASIPPEAGEPDWGRFFVPGKPRPSDEERAALLERFKDWTRQRAAALPQTFRMFYRFVNLQDGQPISPIAPYTPQSGNPNSDAGKVNECKSSMVSYPDLAPACEYLEGVLTNQPQVYPFGRGDEQAGPRIVCMTVLLQTHDPYCQARKELFDKDQFGQPAAGFHDVFVFDREVFFPGTEAEFNGLPRSSLGMALDVEIAGVTMADKPVSEPFVEAHQRYQAYREGIGAGPSGYGPQEPPPPGTYFMFDANVLAARLVEPKSGELVANLDVREARAVDLAALQVPEKIVSAPEEPFGPDIVGLRLGMTFDQADELIRSHMAVGRVLAADRAMQFEAAKGDIDAFTSGRLYVSEDASEFIIIYDEPPAASGVILGVTRQVVVPKGKIPAAAMFARLREKYGQENWSYDQMVAWGESLSAKDTMEVSQTGACVPGAGNATLKIWREEDGAETDWRAQAMGVAGTSIPGMNQMFSGRTAICEPTVSALFDTERDNAADRLVVQLVDYKRYDALLAESKRQIETGEASFTGDAAAEVDFDL